MKQLHLRLAVLILISIPIVGCVATKNQTLTPTDRYHLMNRACCYDDAIGVETLLGLGADPLGARDYGVDGGYGIEYMSHIESAIRSAGDDVEILKMLLEAGVNPNIQGTEGATPLACAVSDGKLARAKFLVEHGADPFDKSVSMALDNTQHEVLKTWLEDLRRKKRPNQALQHNAYYHVRPFNSCRQYGVAHV